VKQIKDVEHLADQLTQTINVRIDKSFITPIEPRGHSPPCLASDDVIDSPRWYGRAEW